MTGIKLEFPLMLRPQTKLRARIEAWAADNGMQLEPAIYGKPASPSRSGTFVTKQKASQKFMQALRSLGQFLISKRPFDCQLY